MLSEQSIRIFLAVAECNSLSAAARQLHFSQPTASDYLKQLEDRLGAKLVLREKGSRYARLTQAGQAFLPLAKRWVEQYSALENMISDFAHSQKRNALCIAASSNGHQYVVSHIVCRLMQQNPNIELQLRGVERREIPAAIEQKLFDAAFVFGEPIENDNVENIPLFDEDQYILCPASTPLAEGVIAPKDLDRSFEVYYSKHGSKGDSWHKENFPSDAKPYFTVSNLASAYQYLTDKKCWCIAPASLAVSLAANSSNALTYRKIEPMPAPRQCNLLVSREYGREHIIKALLKCCCEYAKDIPYIKCKQNV